MTKRLRNFWVPLGYLAVILFAACWAFYTEARLSDSPREHLLPGFLLAALALPSSMSLGALDSAWPALLSRPFIQVTWLTACGLCQASLLFVLVSKLRRSPKA